MAQDTLPDQVEVLVIGAGLAGLRTATLLEAAGREVCVLEARGRVGGRTLTTDLQGARVDLGGQWVGPTQHRVHALVEELGLALSRTPTQGRTQMALAGHRGSFEGTIPSLPWLALADLQQAMWRIERRIAQVPRSSPWDMPDAEAWDAQTVESLKRRYAHTAAVRGALDVMVRVVFGAEPSEVSALFFLHYLATGGGLQAEVEVEGGAQQDRIVGGAQQLSMGLAERLRGPIVLHAPVEAVAWQTDGVEVRCSLGVVRAERLVVAIPPTLAGRIRWRPGLPPDRNHLHMRVPMGSTTKCFAFYEEPFWRAAGWSGEAMSDDGPLAYVVDNTQADDTTPALLGFMVGGQSRGWQRRDAATRRAAVLEQLASFFGEQALTPTHYQEHRWDEEGFTGGCPIGLMGPGVLTQLGHAWTAPVGPVFWAGTETGTEWAGHMEGALQSAERVAEEVLSS